ncbi:MAG: Translocation protein S62 [Chrysothrix sp. TS-e1954]|nr:MAG: Translocation protein S62 [Chrysothrix sp. TS-e1954]
MAQPMANAVPFPVPTGVGPNGQPMKLSQEQVQAFQQHLVREAQKEGITPQEYAQKLKAQAMSQAQAANQQGGQAQQGGGQQQTGQVPIADAPPKPEAIAIAKFLRSQDLKSRPCVHEERRRDLFKVKRALRALQSPAYTKARGKNALLPPVTDLATAKQVFLEIPRSRLAYRVSRVDPSQNPGHGQPGHVHGAAEKAKQKQKDAIWQVQTEPQQDAEEMHHYVWLYEGSQWMRLVYSIGALVLVIAFVLFPLWPIVLRQGVWYLSMAALGLLGAFFGLAIVRLILFVVSLGAVPPGIWLYPNLFEDVGFFDSFKPLWAWRETKESLATKKSEKKAKKQARKERKSGTSNSKTGSTGKEAKAITSPTASSTTTKASNTTGAQVVSGSSTAVQRNMTARVEEVEDE